ncbi:MAG: hypothetical protein RR033_06780 [Clostridia bacterium]
MKKIIMVGKLNKKSQLQQTSFLSKETVANQSIETEMPWCISDDLVFKCSGIYGNYEIHELTSQNGVKFTKRTSGI